MKYILDLITISGIIMSISYRAVFNFKQNGSKTAAVNYLLVKAFLTSNSLLQYKDLLFQKLNRNYFILSRSVRFITKHPI